MALCDLPNCSNIADQISWTAEYRTLCTPHSQVILKNGPKYPISSILKSSCLEMISLKLSQIDRRISEIFTSSLNSINRKNPSDKEQKLKMLSKWQEKLLHRKEILVSSVENEEENECRHIMVRLNYWISQCSLKGTLYVLEDFKLNLIKEKFRMENRNMEDEIRPLRILEKVIYKKISFEKWHVVREGREEIMKSCYSSGTERDIVFFRNELEFLKSNGESKMYLKVAYSENHGAGLRYFTEFVDDEFARSLLRKRYKVNEAISFLRFVTTILDRFIGHLEIYYFDPTMISYTNKTFLFTDFKYKFSTPLKKYLSPYHGIDRSNLYSCHLYSAGMIVLEMFGVSIEGLNSFSTFPVLLSLIGSQNLSKPFSDLLKSILSPNPPTPSSIQDIKVNIKFLG